MVPRELKYSESHEWVKQEGAMVIIGITDYAQEELGDVVFVELPKVSRQLKQQESFGVAESVKAVSDLFSPVTGKVMAINETLAQQPELVNKEPYAGGWMIKVELSDNGEIANLMSAEEYEKFIQEGPK
ncbi:MAG: glycine cleavage system protein GcvH [Elusimicrobia bacterium]|nr:glycine cleavage system protein GcvH [Elusimicrobiota bacterium]